MMNKHSKPQPTESELGILKVLWQDGPSSVRHINDLLNKERETGYTTTLKLMQIMLEKKLVTRNEEKRTHIYAANVSQESAQKGIIAKILNTAFSGSAKNLVLQALGNHDASLEELNEVKALITKLENEKKS